MIDIYFMSFSLIYFILFFFFFFQAEDGIRDWSVTGVQKCALPICAVLEARNKSFRTRIGEHAADFGFENRAITKLVALCGLRQRRVGRSVPEQRSKSVV